METRFDSRLQLAVLQLTKYGGDISQIAGNYYSYSDIAMVIKDLKYNGIISDLSGVLEITEIGKSFMEKLLKNVGITKKESLILPQYKYFSRKIDKFDIYFRDKDIPR